MTSVRYTTYIRAIYTYSQYRDYAFSVAKLYGENGEDSSFSKSYLEKYFDYIFSAIDKEIW